MKMCCFFPNRLQFNLATLEVMIYDLRMPPGTSRSVDLRKLEEMSDLDVVLKLMEGAENSSGGSHGSFSARVHRSSH